MTTMNEDDRSGSAQLFEHNTEQETAVGEKRLLDSTKLTSCGPRLNLVRITMTHANG